MVVVDNWRRDRLNGLQIGQAAQQIRHVRGSDVFAAMVNGFDAVMKHGSMHAVRDACETMFKDNAEEIGGLVQWRKVAFCTPRRVSRCDCLKRPLMPGRVVLRLRVY